MTSTASKEGCCRVARSNNVTWKSRKINNKKMSVRRHCTGPFHQAWTHPWIRFSNVLLFVRLNKKSRPPQYKDVGEPLVCIPPVVIHFSTGSLYMVCREPFEKYGPNNLSTWMHKSLLHSLIVTLQNRFKKAFSINDTPKLQRQHPGVLKHSYIHHLWLSEVFQSAFSGLHTIQSSRLEEMLAVFEVCHHQVAKLNNNGLPQTGPRAGRCVSPCHDERVVITWICTQPKPQ